LDAVHLNPYFKTIVRECADWRRRYTFMLARKKLNFVWGGLVLIGISLFLVESSFPIDDLNEGETMSSSGGMETGL